MNSQQGVDGLEHALRTFSLKKDGTVNQDQLLIALNKVGAGNLAIDDVKDFFGTVKANEDDAEIDEIMNVLNN